MTPRLPQLPWIVRHGQSAGNVRLRMDERLREKEFGILTRLTRLGSLPESASVMRNP